MKILSEKSCVDEFGPEVAGFRAEVEIELEDGSRLFAYANQIGDMDSYAVARESIYDAIDQTGEDTVERIVEFHHFKDAERSKYWQWIRYADNLVGAEMDDYYEEEL